MTGAFPGKGIGVVVPSVNTVVEGWYPRVVPESVRVNVGRMLIGSTVTPEVLREMDAYGIEAARTVATARPDVIIYGCTASSLVGGRDYDLHLMQQLQDATGTPALTSTESVLRALAHLGLDSVAAASPYTEEVGGAEVTFLEKNGHAVLGHAHLGILNGFDLASPTAEEIADVARRAWQDADEKADAVFIGCMNLKSHLVLDQLEKEFGVPVLSATSASLWAALREIGSDDTVPGYGRLLDPAVATA